MTAVLPQAYDDLRFSFYGRVLSGQQQQRPRDRRAIQATGNALLDAVGQVYVERHFPASAKADIDSMVSNIVEAFDRRLTNPRLDGARDAAGGSAQGGDGHRRHRLPRALAKL
jgi:predicted metalloendopeptidase